MRNCVAFVHGQLILAPETLGMIQIPITTNRLTIRQFEPADVDDYLRFMLDDESTKYLAFDDDQRTETGARALFEYVMHSYDTAETVHAYAIGESSTGAYVGSCGFSPYDDGVVECYYCINPEHRGQGYAVEATNALLDVLTSHVEVRAHCHSDNTAAHAVAKRSGMTHLGLGQHKHSGLEGQVFVLQRP
ncbi:MAG: GNAT family N-acetyltransferase [Pirellulales bacterium]|nr:GNAT family N-acetyltransferase [Pirellulales bacterium]